MLFAHFSSERRLRLYCLWMQVALSSTSLTNKWLCKKKSKDCSLLPRVFVNTYHMATAKFFMDGKVLYSQEDTTQGDQLSIPMYAIAALPLIETLSCYNIAIMAM